MMASVTNKISARLGILSTTFCNSDLIPFPRIFHLPPAKTARMKTPSRKRGRPRIVVTEAVAEARRLAVQQRNARRAVGVARSSPSTSLGGIGCVPSLAGKHRGGVSPLESPRRCNHIDSRKAAFASSNVVHDIGRPGQVCGYCNAQVWAAEFTGRHVGTGPKGYSICCGKGKAHLPLLQAAPPELMALLTGHGSRERKFQQNNRMYNTIFALCSFGGTLDETINNGSAPYVFHVNLQTYHSIGSLLSPDGQALLLGGRLFLQYVVDAWCSVERGRLQWVKRHESTIRSDLYNNLVDCVNRGDVAAADVGKCIVLPSSFTGGYRYMQQNFQDLTAVCKEYGHPDIFITFTCNPKWVEIQRAVTAAGSPDASVRPDLVARVFKMKLDALMSDLTKKDVLGPVLAGLCYRNSDFCVNVTASWFLSLAHA